MASIHDEMGDSRTSAVGRKRNLEEAQDRDVSGSRQSSAEHDAERASKRVKEDDKPLDNLTVEDELIVNTVSPPRAASLSLPTSPSQTSQIPQSEGLTIATRPPPKAWNKGVQSGLRTSFASRAPARRQLKTGSPAVGGEVSEHNSNDVGGKLGQPHMEIDRPGREEQGHVTVSQGTADNVDSTRPQMSSLVGEHDVGETSFSKAVVGGLPHMEMSAQASISAQENGSNTPPLTGIGNNMDQSQLQISGVLGQHQSESTKDTFVSGGESGEISEGPGSPSSASSDSDSESDADDDADGNGEVETPISQSNVTSTVPFKKLSKTELALLTHQEKEAYVKAKAIHTQEENTMKFEALTSEAEAVLAHEIYPLPSKYSSVANNISSGLTLFARQASEKSRIYRVRKRQFALSEILKDGKPIRIQDFSFNIFAPAFLKDNPNGWDHTTQKVLVSAFNSYLNLFYTHVPHLSGEARASASAANAITVMIAKQKARAILDISQPIEKPPTLPETIAETIPSDPLDPMDVEIDQREIEALQKYFPSIKGDLTTYRCLACGESGHKTINCPSMTCNLCGGDHANLACPQNRRCNKCRQRGHQTSDCLEKLSLSKAEGVGCDLCGSTNHLEIACHSIWRSFNPKPEEIRKVRDIPIHCYVCGGAGHYGPECGLHQGPLLSGGYTWSKANRMKYIDAASSDVATSAGIDYSIPARSKKEFNIKGKANNPISLDDTDDDEVSFIRESVKNPRERGQIHIRATSRVDQPPLPNVRRPQNPPRQARSDFDDRTPNYSRPARPSLGPQYPLQDDPARYGPERPFSPPPRYDDSRYNFPEAEDRYRPQAPQRDNFYRPAPQGSLPSRGPPPSMNLGSNSRGGYTGRGGRPQNNGGGGGARSGGVAKGAGKKNKGKRGAENQAGGGKRAARRGK